jgi:hypothetical protein
MKPWHNYSEQGIQELAQNALDAACASIQEALGQEDGGFAGIFFSGEKGEQILTILRQYAIEEIEFMQSLFEEQA